MRFSVNPITRMVVARCIQQPRANFRTEVIDVSIVLEILNDIGIPLHIENPRIGQATDALKNLAFEIE